MADFLIFLSRYEENEYGSVISIDANNVDSEITNDQYQRSNLDYLIYNDQLVYADLILNSGSKAYLDAVTK